LSVHIRQVPPRMRKLEIVFDIPQSPRSFSPFRGHPAYRPVSRMAWRADRTS